jgi:hypothetical protein
MACHRSVVFLLEWYWVALLGSDGMMALELMMAVTLHERNRRVCIGRVFAMTCRRCISFWQLFGMSSAV